MPGLGEPPLLPYWNIPEAPVISAPTLSLPKADIPSYTGIAASEPGNGTGNGTANTGGGGAGYVNPSLGGGGGGAGGVLGGTLTSQAVNTAFSVVVGAGGAPVHLSACGGGSGVVILKYPSLYTATFTSGVTQTTITDGTNKISMVKATTNSSQTVTFS